MADQTTQQGPGQDDRLRRSDQHWRSRRRRRKRDREQQRQHKAELRAQLEEKKSVAREAAELDAEAASADLLAEELLADDLGRTERRMLAQDRRRRAGVEKGMQVATVAAFVAAAVGVGVGLRVLMTPSPQDVAEVAAGIPLAPGVDPQPTLLLVTADEAADPRRAESLILLSFDRVTQQATILLLPTATVADIPGHGVLPVGDALVFGGPALVAATVDNLLGIHVDGFADLTYRDWAGLFSRVGPVEVQVDERLIARNADGTGDVRFLAGAQQLAPEVAAEFLAFAVDGEAELARLPRIQQLLVAHLQAMAQEPARLESVVGDGVPMIDTEMDAVEVSDLLRQVALASVEDRLDVRVLPVRPIGSAGGEGYRPDELRVESLIADRFTASLPNVAREGRQLQILNGMGRPGIGQSVAEILVPVGYRVVLTGNADDFNHEVTRIVIYDDTPEQIEIANEIKRLLGVGVVEVSRTPQSVVDVTIVVGSDFGQGAGAP